MCQVIYHTYILYYPAFHYLCRLSGMLPAYHTLWHIKTNNYSCSHSYLWAIFISKLCRRVLDSGRKLKSVNTTHELCHHKVFLSVHPTRLLSLSISLSPATSFLPLPLYWNTIFTIFCVNKPLAAGSLSLPLFLSVLDFTSRYPSSRRDGRGCLEEIMFHHPALWTDMEPGVFLCSSMSEYHCCLWLGAMFIYLFFLVIRLKKFKRPSHYMQRKLVSGHRCGRGEKINHLSVERLQQGTWLYKESGDWEHSLVSGSCMQTSSWEGGESTHKAEKLVWFASRGFRFTTERGGKAK